MKKIGLVCMLVTSFYAYSTQARVCLLGDPTCNSGISVETAQKCDDYVSRNPKWVKENNLCEAMDYTLACEDYKDRYYVEAGCADGYVATNTLREGQVCKDTQCNGKCCLLEKVKCADEYKECNAPTEGAGDKCIETNTQYFATNPNKFTECVCNTKLYKYNNSNCKDHFEPTGEQCSGDNGMWWKECKSRYNNCKDWNSSAYTQAQVGYKCTATEIPLKNGSKTTCYTNCKVDCEYDGNYYTQEACVGAMDHSVCGADKDGCWYFANCEMGYKYENGKCVADCQYADKAACEKANPNKNCKPDKYGCSVPADCKIGYEDNGFGNCEIVLCPLGSSTNYNTVANCGYPSTIGASVTSTGQYSGSKLCYKCNCSVPSECKWTDANKGDKGTLKDVCCNGTTYKTCTKNFPTDVTVPSNASAIKTSYTACGETKSVITGWDCNLGYVKNSAGTACEVSQCPAGSSTVFTDASKCGFSSTIGASVTSTGVYSGSKLCYTCDCKVPSDCKWTTANKGANGTLSDICCNGTTYKTCTTNFPADVEVPANATAIKTSYTACGETKAVITSWTCNIGYSTNANNNGCVVEQCPTGSSTNYSTVAKCGYASTIGASVTSTGVYSGSKLCYTCDCKVPADCKWTSSNKGDNGTLSDVCCDGQTYKTCTPDLPASVTVPNNASAIKTNHTACGRTGAIVTAWECNLGYIKNSAGTGCDVAQCPAGSSTDYSTAANCGYASTVGASVTSTGKYSAGKLCYTCDCTVPTNVCPWTAENKGEKGELKSVCCDGKSYRSCTKNFPADVTVPDNATASKTNYTACSETKSVTTSWSCNIGYIKNNAGTACDVSPCPDGSSTDYSSVSACGYIGTVGASVTSTGKYSAGKLCYKCVCSAPSECKYTNLDGGTYGTVSNRCCDGKYKTCTTNFPADVTVPANATAVYTNYTGCGTTKSVITGWNCKSGYTKSGNMCFQNSSSSSSGTTGCTNCCSRGFRYCCSGTCTNTKPYSSYQLPNGISTFETCIDYGSYCSSSSSSSSSSGGRTNCCSQGYKYDCTNLGGVCSNTTSKIGNALCLQCNTSTGNTLVNTTSSSGTFNNGVGSTTNNSLLGNTSSGRLF